MVSKATISIADRFGIGAAPGLLRSVRDAVSAWPDFAKAAGVKKADLSRIRKDLVLL